MAIRMKEWGMQAYPRQGVHLPLNAVNDWGRSGRALGQGVDAAGQGLADLLPALEQVARAGKSADAASMLESIARDTTEELMDLPVRDWDYSWQQAYAPRVQEVLNQFSGDEREEVRQLSEVYGARYSLEGKRQMELERLHQARGHWQGQVEAAVQRGDADSARQWLEHGRGLFVPEVEMPEKLADAQNRSLQSRWLNQLQQEPYATLAAWQAPGAQRPAGSQAQAALEAEMRKARSMLLDQLAARVGSAVEAGAEPDAGELQQAVAAGVLPDHWEKNFLQERKVLSTADTCNWLRRIDERGEMDDSAMTVEIALSPLPLEQRRRLLRRVRESAVVPPGLRSRTSRALWNLYHAGYFGCPGDSESMQCLIRLQEEALYRMTTQPQKETDSWVERLSHAEDNWVCLEKE